MVRCLGATLAVLVSLASAPTARAHAILIDSTPAPLGHVPAGPLHLMFRYNSRIDAERSKITLTRPDGTAGRIALSPVTTEDALTANLTLNPGDYTADWQVLATDGHITRGTVPFTVDPAK